MAADEMAGSDWIVRNADPTWKGPLFACFRAVCIKVCQSRGRATPGLRRLQYFPDRRPQIERSAGHVIDYANLFSIFFPVQLPLNSPRFVRIFLLFLE